MPTELELAVRDHEHAKRHLRRVQEERRRCRYNYLDIELSKASVRVERTLARLTELGATPPGGDGGRQHTASTTQIDGVEP